MELVKALDQITEIHEHMAKGELYRGYRPVPIAVSGAIGLGAGLLQPYFLHPDIIMPRPQVFISYWLIVAVLAGAPAVLGLIGRYFRDDDAFARRATRRVVFQFLPSVAAGGLITAALYPLSAESVRLLPGLWALLFGLGIFSSRPYFPRAAGWVALFFLLAGTFLLTRAGNGFDYLGAGLGVVFAVGQFATAAVLYFNVERTSL